jgi:hypothetical protein
MFDAVRSRILRFLRVPHDPDAPLGAPGSVRVFRAGRNFYKLRILRWAIGQVGALAGIIVSLFLLERFEREVETSRAQASQSVVAPARRIPAPAPVDGAVVPTDPSARKKAKARSPEDQARAAVRRVADRGPPWLFGALFIAECFGIALYVLQIPITYAMVRLDYEMRWYIVTDRSLRIRAGLASILETTMSFANVQQVMVTQGPLQRLLGLADVRVQSAGGGGDQRESHGGGDSLHTGVFHGVANATEIRDLIQQRLRAFRQAGLGDPDDAHVAQPTPPVLPVLHRQRSTTAIMATRELLHEARQLRESLR